MNIKASEDLTVAAEAIEADFMYSYESGTPAAARAMLGLATTRLGGGVVMSMRNDVTRYWSKALGFGLTEPVTHGLVLDIVDFYVNNGDSGAVIQLAPSVLPDDWPQICATFGLRPGSRILKLACPVDALQPGQTSLRIDRVDAASAREWASVTLAGFGMPEEGLADMLTASLENEAFQPFAAWDGERMVAGGNLYVKGEFGSLNSGGTLPDHRGKGAQSALIGARAEAAAMAGCRWLIAETGESGTSLNNLRRAGMEILYTRQNWLWQA